MMKTTLVILFFCGNAYSCNAQLKATLNNQSRYYKAELERAQTFAQNAIDTNELKFALWMNKDFDKKNLGLIKEILQIPYLQIQDNCFVALDCDYSKLNFVYCLNFKEPEYKEYFIQLDGGIWTHFIYKSKDPISSGYSKEFYMQADIAKISVLLEYRNKNLVTIERNLCFFDKGQIYTFLKGKPKPLYDYYSDWVGHKPHYINGCTMPNR